MFNPAYYIGPLKSINPHGQPIVYHDRGRAAVVFLKSKQSANAQQARAGSGVDVFTCHSNKEILKVIEIAQQGGATEVLLDSETTDDGSLVWEAGIAIPPLVDHLIALITKEHKAADGLAKR